MEKQKTAARRTKLPRHVWLISLCLSLILGLVLGSGLLRSVDWGAEDALYQQPKALDGSVVVVGITADDLAELGAWPWDRSIMAQVIDRLNADPDCMPAAIGLDTLYAGETNAASDAALARAASAGNVAVACSAEFNSTLQRSANGEAYMDDFTLTSLILPFDALSGTARVGHINTMYDTDGVLRHHLWSIPDGDGGELPSLPYQLYDLYCTYWGLSPDFSPPRSQRGFWYVDYTAQPGSYLEYSVSDILHGDFDPEALAGAAVLIGPYDTGLSDDFITAADRAERMYGVEYLANVLDAMLRGESRVEIPDLLQAVGLTVACFLLCLWVLFIPLWAGLLTCLTVGVGGLGLCLALYRGGLLYHPLWLPLAAFFCLAAGLVEHYRSAQWQKQAIRDTFQRYVDPSILQELLREDADALGLQGTTSDIAVLFVDLRGFTSFSEQMVPAQVVSILNEYLTLTSGCVRRYGGTLDKFVGDCTMAFWGAPLPCEDPVYRACRAAMDMVEEGEALSASLEERYGHRVAFGVGVHYGRAVVGNIGSPQRMDYTAIGDTVNTASRLESAAPAGTVYISRRVADLLGDRASVTSLGGVRLKGKAEGFEVLTLDALEQEITDGRGNSGRMAGGTV